MARPPKPCLGCGEPKPPGRGLRYCAACERRPKHPETGPSPCHACGSRENKQPFRHYCDECLELRRWREEKRVAARKLVERYPCRRCGGRKVPGKGNQYCAACKAQNCSPPLCLCCKREPVRAPGKRLCVGCAAESRERARLAEIERGRAREKTEHGKNLIRASRERTRRDPVRYARVLESQRMAYRLRAQRAGRTVRPGVARHERKVYLPGRPLALAMEHLAESSDLKTICEAAGIEERMVTRWRMGELDAKTVDADQVMTALDLLWWDVWTEDTVRVPFFTVHVYANRLKSNGQGTRRLYRCRDYSIPYGDAGPDLARLAEIAAVMAGEAVAA